MSNPRDPRDTIPAPMATVDAEFVSLAADDLADISQALEGLQLKIRSLTSSMRQAAEVRASEK